MTTPSPASVIERLEKAAGPDRVIDREIWACLHGRKTIPKDIERAIPHFTASIDAALTLVPEGVAWTVDGGEDQPQSFEGTVGRRNNYLGAFGANPAIALCIAALKARIQGERP